MRKIRVSGWLSNVSHQQGRKKCVKSRVGNYVPQSKEQRTKANDKRSLELIAKAKECRSAGNKLRAEKLEEMANQLQAY